MENKNLLVYKGNVSAADRFEKYRQKGGIVWLTGLSGSGKSTIAIEAEKRLFDQGRLVYRLDGDHLRQGLCADLGFTEADRAENIRRAGEVARLFCDAGMLVLASFISPQRAVRDSLRNLVPAGLFMEVYVHASLETCMQRDPKGFYQRAVSGEITNYTGLAQPYEPPLAPDLTLNTENYSVEACVEQLLAVIAEKFFVKDDQK